MPVLANALADQTSAAGWARLKSHWPEVASDQADMGNRFGIVKYD